MKNICVICKIEFDSQREAKTCSNRCRKLLSRQDVTRGKNVTLGEDVVTPEINFNFKTRDIRSESGFHENDEGVIIRTAKYWYDVPLAAIPVLQEGWPQMPEYMDGRQYFLWWKNSFEIKDGTPVILNPRPVLDNVRTDAAGESSRKWGA